ncbi:MAG TPA: DUF3443 family protein [Kofleriaceae bacterium]|jgi:hypothetical protein
MAALVGLVGLASCATSPPNDIPTCDPDPAFDPGTWQGSAVGLPFTIQQSTTAGAMRFSIPVVIGGTVINAMLDTGSSGLRIIKGAVPDSAFTCATATATTYSYHSGLELDGFVARATVGFISELGSIATPAPIQVMYVDQVACASSEPDCGANGISIDDFTAFGGFKAILGVRMRNAVDSIGSPLAQLPGQPRFVVQAPAYGGTSGTLTVGPPDTSAFATLQLPAFDGVMLANGTPAWDDRYGIPACLDDATSGVDYCEPAEWDTGNPPTYVEWPAATGDSVLGSGSQISVTIGSLASYAFTVGATPVPGIDDVELEPVSGSGFMNLGTALFFHDDALFDPLHGIVGLRAH